MSTKFLPATGTVAQARQVKKLPKDADALVLGFFAAPTETNAQGDADTDQHAAGTPAAIEVPVPTKVSAEFAGVVLDRLQAFGARGTLGERFWIPSPAKGEPGYDSAAPRLVLAVGLGTAENLDEEGLRRAAGVTARALTATGGAATVKHVATTLGDFGLAAAVEGWILGSYHYTGLNSATATAPEVSFVAHWSSAKKEFVAAQINAEAVVLARDLVNTPANFCYPAAYAEYLAETAKHLDVDSEVLDREQLIKQGFGGVLAVGQGSAREPRVVQLRWQPKRGKDHPQLALVGKGITFDTGGISLKPARTMEEMISDMGGSAAAAATVFAAARLNLPVAVSATVALAENMPSGSATRPGDVITHFGGVTSEIINTDAEGRVVLGDAIAFAATLHPDYLVEVSTLTGAQMISLGNRTAGVMGTPGFRETVAELGRDVGENAWAMPLLEEHNDAVRSQVADIRNSPNAREGGMLYAATYLSHFVPEDTPWAHVDVAGPAWNTQGAYGYTPQRATGAPVRTLIALVEQLAEEPAAGSSGR